MNSIDVNNLAKLIVVIAITLFFLILFIKPILYTSGFIIKSILYSCLMFILNVITSTFGFTVGVNLITGMLCGFLGFYGIIITYITRLIY